MARPQLVYRIELFIGLLEFLWGMLIIGFVIYFSAQYSYLLVLVPVDTLYISVGVGCILICAGLLACYAAGDSRRGKRQALYCAVLVTASCLIAQVVSTVYFRQAVELVIRQNSLVSGQLDGTDDSVHYNNAVLSSYVACCDGCHAPLHADCSNGQHYFANYHNPHCLSNTTSASLCASVEYCADTTQDACFAHAFTSGVNVSLLPYPAVKIKEPLCAFFEKHGLVGHASGGADGGCGGGSPDVYSSRVLDFLEGYYEWALNALTAMCVLQAVSLAAGVCLCQHVSGGRFAKPPPSKGTALAFSATNAF